MTELSDGMRFACPECGASNRPNAAYCFLCGHDLDTDRPEPRARASTSPIPFAASEPVNPYAPPTTFASRAIAFRISSLLMVIALIAVCLGAAHENLFLGIVLAVAVTPALVYTVIMAIKRNASGKPMSVLDKLRAFFVAIAVVVMTAFSALVAFCMTCVPVLFATGGVGNTGLVIALVTSGLAAVAAAYATYRLLTWKGRQRRFAGKP